MSTEDALRGLVAALCQQGFKVIVTSNQGELLNIQADVWRLRAASARTHRATGCASAKLKTIIIFGTPEQLSDHDTVYAVLLHELGHLWPRETHDELLAWQRAFDMAEVVTDGMRVVRAQALASYGLQ